MSSTKKSDMFAKLAAQQAQPPTAEATPSIPDSATPPVPTPPAVTDASHGKGKGKIKGKRENPDYVQANAYLPKKLRRAVERALLDLEEDMDYSTLVEGLLVDWLKSRGVTYR